jgi:hypothetical protein
MPCPGCGSNSRFRGLMLGVMRHVLGNEKTPLVEQPVRRDLSAIGISDSEVYAKHLSSIFSYCNTFLHQEPFLDLCNTESVKRFSNCDLVVCSDILEHTRDDPRTVLANIFGMLSPGGTVALSAPTYDMSSNIEWYPRADDIKVIRAADKFEVRWTDRDGVKRIGLTPRFHGGPGQVLEMRLIAHRSLIDSGSAAGFQVEVLDFVPELGYFWPITPERPGLNAAMDGRILILRRPKKLRYRIGKKTRLLLRATCRRSR